MTDKPTDRISAVIKDVGALAADKTNRDQGYDYISADKILERTGQAMAEAGLIVIPSIVDQEITTVERQGKSPRIDALVHMNFRINIPGIETEWQVIPWVGRGSDYTTPDKAMYKAITSGHKYFLMKLFCIGVGNEDGEHETEIDRQTGEVKEVRPAQAAAKKNGARPLSPEALGQALDMKAEKKAGKKASDGQRQLLAIQLGTLFDGDEDKRHTFTKWATGHASTKDIPDASVLALLDWLQLEQLPEGGLIPSHYAMQEAQAALAEAYRMEGQTELFESEGG